MAVVHSNVWNCNHSCLWMGVINVLYQRDFDGQSGVCGEQSQRRTSAKWCAIIWSVWSFVIACSVECTMSNEECPPGAIIIVFINCIVDGKLVTQQVECDECLFDRNSPHSGKYGFARNWNSYLLKNACWEIYLACFLTTLQFSLNSFIPQHLPGCLYFLQIDRFYNPVISWTDIRGCCA